MHPKIIVVEQVFFKGVCPAAGENPMYWATVRISPFLGRYRQGNPGTRSEVVPEIETVTTITVETSTAMLLRPPPSAWRATGDPPA
jgi:hypothetical protein